MYRRLLTPGHGMGSCRNPHVSWNIPHDPAWYATKRVAPRSHSRKMRKHPYAGARILVYRWALDEMLRKAPKTLEFSERELAYMQLGLHRKKAADSIKEIEQAKEDLKPRVPVVHISHRLEMDELQLASIDMVPADELSWGFVVPSRKRYPTL
ncbi:hypothetical protein Cpir12675_003794 [Ceratocystis pirilliformis]|uniref:Uncharacterized protein n=1 Tax=Ceratocystis pirilliformis TaxID=259994 RepID=A0ABR3Z0K0_9PEZI